MENISRRKFLLAGAAGATGLVAACAGKPLGAGDPLRTNVEDPTYFYECQVSTNQEKIEVKPVGILGDYYFPIPLESPTRKLNGVGPTFGLIPIDESRASITKIGVPGGQVQVDAPKGDLYLPYVYKTDGEDWELSPKFSRIKKVRLITDQSITKIAKKPQTQQGKIDLTYALTEKDFPFSDETLETAKQIGYLVNPAKDIEDENVLPIYFTRIPFKLELNYTKEDGLARIVGDTFLFSKGSTIEEYIDQRGFTNPLEQKPSKEKPAAEKVEAPKTITDTQQD